MIKKLFNEAVKNSISNIQADYTRLKIMEKEYKKLLTIIEVFLEQDIILSKVMITITPLQELKYNSWKEIIEHSKIEVKDE